METYGRASQLLINKNLPETQAMKRILTTKLNIMNKLDNISL